jgi:GAF domain-containing protein
MRDYSTTDPENDIAARVQSMLSQETDPDRINGADRANGHRSQARTASLEAVYAELASIVLRDQPLGAVMRRIAELARQAVEGADEVSVTLLQHGKPRTVAFSGSLAAVLDERQYEQGFGPCMDAAATGTTISIEDTSVERAYGEFARQASRHGVRHVLAVGMPTPMRDTTGAINIYGMGSAGPFTPDARRAASAFAVYASVAMANAALYTGAVEEVSQMQQALTTRAVIEQAKGIVMATRRCSADQAFNVLREASSRSNRKLRDVAQSIVDETVE